MIEEIKKRLDAGEVVELECVDIKAISTSNKSYAEALLSEPLIVSHIFANKIIFKSQLFIYEAELQYFRIKRPAPTFDDLIDIAVKAYKDGRIDNLELTKGVDGGAGVRINSNRQFTNSQPLDGINFIKSLYTETFVIESQSDLSIIKLNDKKTKVKLTNGELVNDEFWDNLKNMTGKTQFLILKGATVTQKRGK